MNSSQPLVGALALRLARRRSADVGLGAHLLVARPAGARAGRAAPASHRGRSGGSTGASSGRPGARRRAARASGRRAGRPSSRASRRSWWARRRRARGTSASWRRRCGSRRTRPTNARGDSSYQGSPVCQSKSGSGIGVFANGSSTLFWQEASARFCSSVRRVPLLRRTRKGTVARSCAARPRSSSSRHEPARLADERDLGVERHLRGAHAGQRVAREGAELGSAVFERGQRRAALAQHVAQLGDRGAQVVLLAREAGHVSVEAGDEVLQRLLVAGQRAEHARLPVEHAGQVVRLVAQVGVAHLRGVPVGVLPVLDRLVEAARAATAQGGRVLLEERWRSCARLGLERGQQLDVLHRRGGLVRADRVAGLELVRVGAPGWRSTK